MLPVGTRYKRHWTTRRLPDPMDFDSDVAGWVEFGKSFLLVVAGGVGVMVAGWFRARADNKRTRAENDLERDRDRAVHELRRNDVESLFMEGLLKRVNKLEEELETERRTCREDMEKLRQEIMELRLRQNSVVKEVTDEVLDDVEVDATLEKRHDQD